MKRIATGIGLLALLASAPTAQGQNNKELAKAKANEAIKLEDDEGKYDEALILLNEACKLDPSNMIYPYEMAYTYTAKEEYKKAVEILEPLLKHKDVDASVYSSLGNNYDYLKNPEKAITTYNDGLKKFPKSGELYLELGNMKLLQKEYDEALVLYEKGIAVDPGFPSNYYRAAKLFLSSTEEGWGLLYGEIFVNMERLSKRTEEISKSLYDTYKSEIKHTSDTSASISFFDTQIINAASNKKAKLPFASVYEMQMLLASMDEKNITIAALNRIRTKFLDFYLKGNNAKDYPNMLFDYQQKVAKAGHFEAYNYWILKKGNEAEFKAWAVKNEEKLKAFVIWFNDNKMEVDAKHTFLRTQY